MKILSLVFLFLLISPFVFSHEGDTEEINIDDRIREDSIFALYMASVISIIFVVYSVYSDKKPHFTNKKKVIAFLGIVVPVILATIYLVGSTIYLNTISHTSGPVHWHADFEIYACGSRVDIIDPIGISNRVGTSVFHEHGDDRIHVEGVVIDPKDVDLHNFFEVIGGELTRTSMTVPVGYDLLTFRNGDACNGYAGTLQAFLYRTDHGRVIQEKLADFENYILSPHPLVPPGDCIIIEFEEEKPETNRICETYRIAIEKGAVSYGG